MEINDCFQTDEKPKQPSVWRLMFEAAIVIAVALSMFKAVIYLAEISQ